MAARQRFRRPGVGGHDARRDRRRLAHHRRRHAPAAQPACDPRPTQHHPHAPPREKDQTHVCSQALRRRGTAAVVGRVAVPARLRPRADPADPASRPAAADVIGVGSDTSEFALNYLADGNGGIAGYNAGTRPTSSSAGTPRRRPVRHRDHQPARQRAATRPNGSGAGKALLYGAGNVADIDFARSSSALSADREAARASRPSRSPRTPWRWPPPRSPTRRPPSRRRHGRDLLRHRHQLEPARRHRRRHRAEDPAGRLGHAVFFVAQLKAANGGTAVTLAGTVAEVQEHDASPDQERPQRRRAVLHRPQRRARHPAAHRGRLHGRPRALQRGPPGRPSAEPEIQAVFGDDRLRLLRRRQAADRGRRLRAAAAPPRAASAASHPGPRRPTCDHQQVATTTTVAGTSPTAGALTPDRHASPPAAPRRAAS